MCTVDTSVFGRKERMCTVDTSVCGRMRGMYTVDTSVFGCLRGNNGENSARPWAQGRLFDINLIKVDKCCSRLLFPVLSRM